ncbi:MAG: AAA family ATPase [Actinomycetota bacterium]|nr:AAA family ATPase [Actinomycetota bacterium]
MSTNHNDPVHGKEVSDRIASSGKYNGTAVVDPWPDGEPTKSLGDFVDVEHLAERDLEDNGGELLQDQDLGDHDDHGGDHDGGDHSLGDEFEIEQQLRLLRIRNEAKQRLERELQPQIELPPISSLTELLSEPDEPAAYRIDKLALEGARVLLSAQYKAGKTTLVLNLIRSLADGDPFLGRFDVTARAQRIVLIDDELDRNTLRRWLREQGIVNTGAVVDVINLRGRLASFNLMDDRCREQWIRRLADLGCDYLILDCLRPVLDTFGLDENRDAGKFLVQFDTLLNSAGISNAALVQHMGHTGERSRGDSRLQDWPDAIWRLVRESEDPTSARFFSAYGRDVDVAEGRLNHDNRRLTFVAGNRDDAKTEAAVIAVLVLLSVDAVKGGNGFSSSAIEKDLGGDHTQKSIRAALKKLVQRGRVTVTPGARNAKLHTVTKPCKKCGMPMLTDDQQHLSCGDFDVEGLFT